MNEGASNGASEAGVRESVKRALSAWMEEAAPSGIFTTDSTLTIVSWNHWMETHSHRAAQDMIGKRLFEAFPDLVDRRLADRYLKAVSGEASVLSTALHQFLLPFATTMPESGARCMLQTARISPLRDGDRIVGTITTIEDVTQREFHANILRRQQDIDRLLSSSLAVLLQSSDPVGEMGGIFSSVTLSLGIDSHASFLFRIESNRMELQSSGGLSPANKETLGRLQPLPRDFSQLRAPGAAEGTSSVTLASTLGRMGIGPCVCFPLIVGTRLSGVVAFGSYDSRPVPTSDIVILARIARYVAIAIDRAEREKDTLVASRAKDDFLAALSHELRTPLNPVLLIASDSAENTAYSEEVREAFRVIEKNAMLEARLIDDLLDLTRIERGKLSLDLRLFSLSSVLTDAMEAVRGEAKAKGIAFDVDLVNGNDLVNADSVRLQQVFWNVIKNAIKFTPEGGHVWVESHFGLGAEEIVVTVRDTGIGMTSTEIEQVFGAFTQGAHAIDGRSHRFGGLGLGLAISRRLIDMHGGTIDASSEGKDKGSIFTIRLPLARAKSESPPPFGRPTPSSAEGMDTREHLRHRKILLVEDHEATRVALSQLLRNRQFEVVSAGSLSEALNHAGVQNFDMVLSDIGLPDGDGFLLMSLLSERHGLRGVSLTGFDNDGDIARSAEAGFSAHLTKPIDVTALDRALTDFFETATP